MKDMMKDKVSGPVANLIQVLKDKAMAGDLEAKERLNQMGIKLP